MDRPRDVSSSSGFWQQQSGHKSFSVLIRSDEILDEDHGKGLTEILSSLHRVSVMALKMIEHWCCPSVLAMRMEYIRGLSGLRTG
jgi:hypothetical protein